MENRRYDYDTTQPPESSHVGRYILHYHILDYLGGGGMGEVFLAQDTKLQRLVALKTIRSDSLSEETSRRYLVAEAQAAARLSHRNICTVFAIEETEATLFLAMEYVSGRTLRKIARHERLSPQQLFEIGSQCAEGLQAAHEAGILHKDIKSSNIMLDQRGTVKIADFGLALPLADQNAMGSPPFGGTFHYMSPEQISGGPIDERSDLFSLGVVLYELSCGRLPFEGASRGDVADAILNMPPPPLEELRDDLPRDWISIVDRLLAKNAGDRFQTAGELHRCLTAGDRVAIDPLTHPLPSRSLAVLPFKCLSPTPEITYVCDGVTEQIISRLSRVGQLRVVSWSTISRFRQKETEPIEFARKLEVGYYLDGSLRCHKTTIRMAISLVRIEDLATVWSEVIEHDANAIFDLESVVAEQVVSALKIELTAREERRLSRQPTNIAGAYDLYLRGKYQLRARNKESTEQAIDCFQRATEIDTTFARAYAHLAAALCLYHNYGYGEVEHLAPRAQEAASRAISLDAGAAETHMAMYLVLRLEDTRRAEQELRIAVALNPNSAEIHHYLGHSCVGTGLLQCAELHERIALRLDPFQDISRANLTSILGYRGQYERAFAMVDEIAAPHGDNRLSLLYRGRLYWFQRAWERAAESLRRALKLDPTHLFAIDMLSDCLVRLGALDEARDLLERALPGDSSQSPLAARLGLVHAAAGDHQRSRELFAAAREHFRHLVPASAHPNSAVLHYNLAWIASIAGEPDTAMCHLTQAVGAGFGNYCDLRTRPDWDCLQDNADFRRLIERLEKARSGADDSASSADWLQTI